MSENKIGFLGQGFSFPPRLDKTTGRFIMCSGETDVKEAIYIILMTKRYERAMLPEFGSDMHRYVFDVPDPTAVSMLEDEIVHTITRWEPRVIEVRATVKLDDLKDGKVMILIDYVVRVTNSPDNLVFPYYIYEGGKGDE